MHVLEMYVFFIIMQILAFDTELANNDSDTLSNWKNPHKIIIEQQLL